MLRVRVLGPLALEADGGPLEPPASLRARLLLAWLALHPGRHGRGELAARLRPDVLDESARQSLRQALWALRGSIGEDAIVATRNTVGLADEGAVDAREFDDHFMATRYDGALALVRGDLLAGLDEDWVLSERDAFNARLGALLQAGACARADQGDLTGAVGLARRWTRLDPLSEDAARDLMGLLAEAGDRAAALSE